MKKVLLWTAIGIGGSLVLFSLVLDFFVAKGVERLGTGLTGTNVQVGSADVSLYAGRVEINDLRIANPPGYETPHAVEVRRIRVLVPFSRLLNRRIEVDRVLVEAPWVHYEMQDGRTNVRTILDALKRAAAAEPEKEPGDSREIIIRHLLIRDGKAVAYFNGPRERGTEFDVPAVRLQDLGDRQGGISIDEAVTRIFAEIIKAGTGVVTNPIGRAGKSIGETLKNVGEGLKGLFE